MACVSVNIEIIEGQLTNYIVTVERTDSEGNINNFYHDHVFINGEPTFDEPHECDYEVGENIKILCNLEGTKNTKTNVRIDGIKNVFGNTVTGSQCDFPSGRKGAVCVYSGYVEGT